MKNFTTFVRMRSSDNFGDAEMPKKAPRFLESAYHKAQIAPVSETNAFLICPLRSVDFLRWCLSPEHNLTHNLFLYFK